MGPGARTKFGPPGRWEGGQSVPCVLRVPRAVRAYAGGSAGPHPGGRARPSTRASAPVSASYEGTGRAGDPTAAWSLPSRPRKAGPGAELGVVRERGAHQAALLKDQLEDQAVAGAAADRFLIGVPGQSAPIGRQSEYRC